jgi:hypothetical protein
MLEEKDEKYRDGQRSRKIKDNYESLKGCGEYVA